MGAFWESWQLWEKMCFVLGVAIVLTILAGCVKLIHKHLQLKKFTKIAAEKREQQMLQTEPIPPVRRSRGVAVPFGVRAIESGIEVEGVWISRSNTPAPSSPRSLAASPTPGSPASQSAPEQTATDSIPPLAMPQPVYAGARPGNQSRSPSRSPAPSHQRSVSAERTAARSHTPPSESTPVPRGRQTYQPRQSSHLRYSSGEMLGRNLRHDPPEATFRSTSAQSRSRYILPSDSQGQADLHSDLEASPPTQRISDSSLDSSTSDKPTHYIPRHQPHHPDIPSTAYASVHQTPVDMLPFTRHSRSDLDQLATHRQTHAAETGQLLPRVRHGGGGSSSSSDSISLKSSSSDKDPPEHHPAYHPDPFATPPRTRLPTTTSDLIDPPSFQSFVQSGPSSPAYHAYPYPAPPPHSSQSSSSYYYPTDPTDDHPPPPLQEADANRSRRHSQVVRKVNSAFEILQPGSLDPRVRGAGEGEVERRGPRKLRKREGGGIAEV